MATKEAVFSLRVDTGNSVQDIQNADIAVKNLNKDLKDTQATTSGGTGVNKFATDLAALDAKIKTGGLSMREMTKAIKDYQTIAINFANWQASNGKRGNIDRPNRRHPRKDNIACVRYR